VVPADENTRGVEITALGLGTLYAYCSLNRMGGVFAFPSIDDRSSSGQRLRSNKGPFLIRGWGSSGQREARDYLISTFLLFASHVHNNGRRAWGFHTLVAEADKLFGDKIHKGSLSSGREEEGVANQTGGFDVEET